MAENLLDTNVGNIDYISRQAAIDTVKYDYYTGYTQLERVNEIKAIPAADVVPVVHGEWERIPYSFVGGYRCPRCGQKTMENSWLYCPNCGAKMDGKMKE